MKAKEEWLNENTKRKRQVENCKNYCNCGNEENIAKTIISQEKEQGITIVALVITIRV